MDRAALLWTAATASALVGAPLVFANAFSMPMRGQNEELGAALFLLASLLAVAGAFVRGWRTRAGQVGLAMGVAIPVLFGVWLGVVLATVPDHDATRTIEFERVDPPPADAPTMAASELPLALRDALAAPQGGTRGWANLPKATYDELWLKIEAVAPERPSEYGRIVVIDGVAWRFTPGAVM